MLRASENHEEFEEFNIPLLQTRAREEGRAKPWGTPALTGPVDGEASDKAYSRAQRESFDFVRTTRERVTRFTRERRTVRRLRIGARRRDVERDRERERERPIGYVFVRPGRETDKDRRRYIAKTDRSSPGFCKKW